MNRPHSQNRSLWLAMVALILIAGMLLALHKRRPAVDKNLNPTNDLRTLAFDQNAEPVIPNTALNREKSEMPLETRLFLVPTNFFTPKFPRNLLDPKSNPLLTNAAAESFYKLFGASTTNMQHNHQLVVAIRRFLVQSGVDLSTNNVANAGKSFIWKDRQGFLLVRARRDELDSLGAAIQLLLPNSSGQKPPTTTPQTAGGNPTNGVR